MHKTGKLALIISGGIILIFIVFINNRTNKRLTLLLEGSVIENYKFNFEEADEKLNFTPNNIIKLEWDFSSYNPPKKVYNHMFNIQKVENLKFIKVSGYIFCVQPPKNLSITISINENKQSLAWEIDNICKKVGINEWRKFESTFMVNHSKINDIKNTEISVFTYNNSLDEFYLDDYNIELHYE